jgi:MscS family membrane protein
MITEYLSEADQALQAYVNEGISPYFIVVLVLACSYLLGEIVSFVFSQIIVKLALRNKSETDNHIVRIVEPAIFYSVLLLGFDQAILFLEFLDGYKGLLIGLITSVLVIVWTDTASKIAHIVIDHLGSKVAERSRYKIDLATVPLFRNLSSIVVWFIGAAVLLNVWNLDLTPLLASAGIAGLAIAFAAQDTISHLFGGLSIYFDKPFRVGDRIQLDSGDIGDVLEIGLRSTKIKTFDETVVVIPNNTVASSRIINYNKPKSKIKVKIEVGLAYGTNIAKAKAALLDVVEKTEGVEKDPEPSVYFTEMGDFSLKFLIVAWVANPKKQFDVKTRLLEGLYARINKEKFNIPYPTQEVLLRKINR